ncbi:hypothetical protein QEH68_06635 [Paenarthrobacter sp. OM7]|nr:hypothetical protein [Paenarthrobacter sp. OM7]WGM21844.1 hypothetical protein QEH68_06635 [Paenarthrobacter sp. OM7]
MTPAERVEQLSTCCPQLARNLSLLTAEQLADVLAETTDAGAD